MRLEGEAEAPTVVRPAARPQRGARPWVEWIAGIRRGEPHGRSRIA
jgi:hypothetical protein